jgi:hypothetical protein
MRGSNRDDWRKLHNNNELHNFSSSKDIMRVMKVVGHTAYITRNAYKILVGKPEGKRELGRARHDGGIVLKWI